jgi:arylsulfatase A-like enzyme
VRVPLVFVAPGVEGGQRIAETASTIDVPVTLLDLLGLPAEPRFEGRSLAPHLRAGVRSIDGDPRAPTREILLELAHRGGAQEVRQHSFGLVRDRQKLLVDAAGDAWVYDLDADPAERAPEAAESSDRGRRLLATLAALRADLAGRTGASPARVDLDDDTRRRLRALGYAVD